MVNRNLEHNLDVAAGLADWETELNQALENQDLDAGKEWRTPEDFGANCIVEGVIVRIDKEFVLVDIGSKSEGAIKRDEWGEDEEAPQVGQKVKALIEEDEESEKPQESRDMIMLSKRKAEKIEAWENVMKQVHEGDIVEGEVTRKIKGGLLVDIGVNVFLPASQVDIRRPSDIADFIGKPIKCVVLKIDEARRNIVVSRRALIEEERKEQKQKLLSELQEGQLRMGTVKNIADFGAFVDLGGIDGLLHITDMSWGRINHPSEMLKIDDQIEVKILSIDREKEKISLGLKQKQPSPWEQVAEKYPVGAKVKGTIVSITNYGAFAKLEEGIEGLIHISEMSWTKRINHPNELVSLGDEVEVVVLGINKEKKEISLGMKQTAPDPWKEVAQEYPVGSVVTGTVRNLTNYGAFIQIRENIDGLLHVSDMSWTRKVSHPSEMVKRDQVIECKVLSVDEKNRRIALGLKQMTEDPWTSDIPKRFAAGQLVKGKVTKITNFGVFVRLEDGLEGLLHISELADHKVDNPEEVVHVDEEIEVKILRVDIDERKIGLSRKRVEWSNEEETAQEAAEEGAAPSAKPTPATELKGGLGGGDGKPLFSLNPDNE